MIVQPAKGASLRQLLLAIGDQLVEVLTAPRGLDDIAHDVVILDPDDAPDVRPGDVVLLIGLRGRAAVPVVRAAARRGALAIAVKSRDDVLTQAATDEGVALLAVRPDARWEQLESLARSGILSGADAEGEAVGDLFSLAQTIAALTGGLISIEDTSNRVLAYSRSSDEVDELRRLSILGRQGPEPYMQMLRDWGVYQRLRESEEVVPVEERPELGIRRRIAVGVHAGNQPLGAIWVQEGATALLPGAAKALVGAARVTALHLVRSRNNPAAEMRLRESLLEGLLDGNTTAAAVAANIGADPLAPAGVVVFTLADAAADRSVLELRRAEMTNLIAVHTAAYRRAALVTTLGARVYALLPELRTSEGVLALTKDIVAAARKHVGITVRAAVGVAADLSRTATARREADRVLDAGLDIPVASIADVRAQVVLSELLTLLGEHPEIRDPRLDLLADYDARHASNLVPSVLAYLEALGDVRAAARGLNVHPNTLRYRIRRATEIAGIDLDDPKQRLVTQLQLTLTKAG
ncbi:PucR family transcriptional regulator [Actinocrispum wychmicini]|uniref:DNA-binding PucR family transcriptional regulator n=1 Tax=Actinocrispum wychmicini TaxID=1213861 RepID=A0A4R2ITR5_9PSEU|nr:helix-turn-helix domain-containing protein [Actinocrispum wychmicini]TCO48893.1 DNA-binding PucR family transcriptional regulator [Actinocrispum wychmicini]